MMQAQPSNASAPNGGAMQNNPQEQIFAASRQAHRNNFTEMPSMLKAPEEIACFSYDENLNLHLDSRSLAYYFSPSPRGSEKFIDLSKGMNDFRQRDDSKDDHLHGLLTAIMDKEKKNQAKLDAHFISYRGMMTNGTIFIEEDKQAKLKARKNDKKGHQSNKNLQFYGFKFETLYTIPDIWDNVSREEIEGRDEKVVDNHPQYCSVVKTSIGETSMIIGGEVDCIWDQKIEGETRHEWIELKTTEWIPPYIRPDTRDRKLHNYDWRKLKYWAQSYLIGCPRVIVGKRDYKTDRLMMPLDAFYTLDIPKEATTWDARVCKQTWAGLLKWLHEKISGQPGVWKLSKKGGEDVVRLVHDEPTGTGEILTDEFIAHRQSMTPSSAGVQVDETDDVQMEE
ncbi:decapping endonuclease targeting mRNA [Botryosphaeria dothidea]